MLSSPDDLSATDLSFASARARAFPTRPALLDARSLRASVAVTGDVERLRRALSTKRPVTIAAIGSSNVVRGGCEAWQKAKCSHPKYTNRSLDDGTPRGWLLQAFEAMGRVWPTLGHKLVNRALMATGPSGFQGCLNNFVPLETDVALIGFADICTAGALPLHNSTFGLSLESIVRELASRPDPPTILFYNYYKFVSWSCTLDGGMCAYWMTCDAQMQELAQFYGASTLTVRNAMYHRGAVGFGGTRGSKRLFQAWTQDNSGHFDLALGDKYAAEMLLHWMWRVAREPSMVPDSTEGPPPPPPPATRRARPRGRAADSAAASSSSSSSSSSASSLPFTWYSSRTCWHEREQRLKPCLYTQANPPSGAMPDKKSPRAKDVVNSHMTCYTFDDPLDGAAAPPTVLAASKIHPTSPPYRPVLLRGMLPWRHVACSLGDTWHAPLTTRGMPS